MSNYIKKVIIAKYLNDKFCNGMVELEAIIAVLMGYPLLGYSGGGSNLGFFAFTIADNIDNKILIERANKYLKEKDIDSIKVIDVCDFNKFQNE